MDNWDNNHWLVVDLPLPKILVNGKDDIPYMTWKIKNVPNHQPEMYLAVDISLV